MARRTRSSQAKREREDRKRERQRRKAEKTAQKRERRFGQAHADVADPDAPRPVVPEPPAEDAGSPQAP